MKNKLGIICVSSGYLSAEYVEKHDIKIVDLAVVVDGVSYNESSEIDNEKIFAMMDNGSKVTTSQPSPEMFLNAMNELSAKYNRIMCFVISSGLSGAYNSALIALQMYDGDAEISVIDTLTAAMGMTACIDYALSEDDVEFSTTIKRVKDYVEVGKTFLSIDDLTTLVKTGRMRASSALIGNLLKVKPLLCLDELGKVIVFDKVRTRKKLATKFAEVVESFSPKKVYVAYVGKKENVEDLIQMFSSKLNNVEIILCQEVGPVLAVHLGKGGMGIYFSVGTQKI